MAAMQATIERCQRRVRTPRRHADAYTAEPEARLLTLPAGCAGMDGVGANDDAPRSVVDEGGGRS